MTFKTPDFVWYLACIVAATISVQLDRGVVVSFFVGVGVAFIVVLGRWLVQRVFRDGPS